MAPVDTEELSSTTTCTDGEGPQGRVVSIGPDVGVGTCGSGDTVIALGIAVGTCSMNTVGTFVGDLVLGLSVGSTTDPGVGSRVGLREGAWVGGGSTTDGGDGT